MVARIIRKADRRAARRFKVAMAKGVAVDGTAPETRLWTEAEALARQLRWEQRKRRYDAEQAKDAGR